MAALPASEDGAGALELHFERARWSRERDGALFPAQAAGDPFEILVTRAALGALVGLDSSEVSAADGRSILQRFSTTIAAIAGRKFRFCPAAEIRIGYEDVERQP